jgi:hypothetical protein
MLVDRVDSRNMEMKMFLRSVLAVAIILSTSAISFAQSQRNYGPNGPTTGDTFGEPYSGSAAARRGDWLPYSAHNHHGWHRYWYR